MDAEAMACEDKLVERINTLPAAAATASKNGES
jgi:hypothetical protein